MESYSAFWNLKIFNSTQLTVEYLFLNIKPIPKLVKIRPSTAQVIKIKFFDIFVLFPPVDHKKSKILKICNLLVYCPIFNMMYVIVCHLSIRENNLSVTSKNLRNSRWPIHHQKIMGRIC